MEKNLIEINGNVVRFSGFSLDIRNLNIKSIKEIQGLENSRTGK